MPSQAEINVHRHQRVEQALTRATTHLLALEAVVTKTKREVGSRLARLQRMLSELRARSDRMRLENLVALFGPLERVVRDSARELARCRSGWETSASGEIGIEHRLCFLQVVVEAPPQWCRNAITHGIESPAERQASGKPAAGSVRVAVRCRRCSHISIALSDDGRGIDFAAVRAKTIERGVLSSSAASDQGALVRVLLAGGLSTSSSVTGMAGRGVGLDVMRAAVERVHGTVALTSEPGRGTTLEVLVPATLVSAPSLIANAGGSFVAIPLDAVVSTRRIPESEVVHSSMGDAVVVDERTLPLLPLAMLIGASASSRTGRSHRTGVVLASGQSEAAVEVDRLIGTADVTARPFPPGVRPVAVLSGAGVDDAGAPRLVLEAAAAIAEVRAPKAGSVPATPPAPDVRRLPILVIDDSLTTRTLEQSILESAGYEVDIAVSAEQALVMAVQRRYGLFVVDVEMPGMDGFTFVSTTRAHPQHHEIPAILVTSRKRRCRGSQARSRGGRMRLHRQGRVRAAESARAHTKDPRMTVGRIRVLIVEDSITVRRRLIEVIGSDAGMEVVGEAVDGLQATQLCRALRPDIVMLDLAMPVMDGLAVTEYIMAHCPTPILIVSGSTERNQVFKTYDALTAGAVEILEKPRGDEVGDGWERGLLAMVRLVLRASRSSPTCAGA